MTEKFRHDLAGQCAPRRIDLRIAFSESFKNASSPGIRRERRRVEHHASANGHYRRKLPQDEAVSGQQQRGLGQAQLSERSFVPAKLVSDRYSATVAIVSEV